MGGSVFCEDLASVQNSRMPLRPSWFIYTGSVETTG